MIKDNKNLIEELIKDDIRKFENLITFLKTIKGEREQIRFWRKCIKKLNEMLRYTSYYYDDNYPIEKIKKMILERDSK